MPDYLLFDAVGTLIQPVDPVAKSYFQQGQRFGSQLIESEIKRRFKANFRRLFMGGGKTITTELDQKQRWRDLVANIFDDVKPVDDLFQDLWDYFGSAESWCLYDDVECNWPKIESSGLKICLASNFDERLFELAKNMEPLSGIEHIFCSSQIGFQKPDGRFFAAIESQLPPGEFLMVGDDIENDFRAPKNAGWNSILLDRNQRHGMDGSIISLQGLIEYLQV